MLGWTSNTTVSRESLPCSQNHNTDAHHNSPLRHKSCCLVLCCFSSTFATVCIHTDSRVVSACFEPLQLFVSIHVCRFASAWSEPFHCFHTCLQVCTRGAQHQCPEQNPCSLVQCCSSNWANSRLVSAWFEPLQLCISMHVCSFSPLLHSTSAQNRIHAFLCSAALHTGQKGLYQHGLSLCNCRFPYMCGGL